MSIATDTARFDRAALLDELRAAGANVTRPNAIKCPFHDDKNPSAGIFQGDDRVYRYKCHGCDAHGDVYDIRARRTGQPLADVLKAEQGDSITSNKHRARSADDSTREPAKPLYPTIDRLLASMPGTVEAHYQYTDPATGNVDLLVVRLLDANGRKTFRQARQVAGGFMLGASLKPWPLYNRARVRQADRVVVVEGEKCVHALHDVGFVATTSPGGAGKAAHTDWRPLAGKTVYLWPDNDPVDDHGQRKGIAHMREVERILRGLTPAPRLYGIDPDRVKVTIGGQP